MPYITALYAALLALLVVGLSLRVALYRVRHRVEMGTGGHDVLQRRIRVHGNAVEFIPLGVSLLLLLELCGVSATALHALGAAFLLARLMHALGMGSTVGVSVGRAGGATLTFALLAVMAVWLLVIVSQRI